MGKMRNNEDESRKDKDAKSWMAWPGKVKSQGTHEIFESMYKVYRKYDIGEWEMYKL